MRSIYLSVYGIYLNLYTEYLMYIFFVFVFSFPSGKRERADGRSLLGAVKLGAVLPRRHPGHRSSPEAQPRPRPTTIVATRHVSVSGSEGVSVSVN